MVIMQMRPEKNLQVLLMSPWVTHLFTGEWAYNWGAYKLGGGLKAVVYGSLCQTFRYWGRCKENKTKKNPAFLMLYFSLSECLERVTISYII